VSQRPTRSTRVLILYCEEGDGHAAAARSLAGALEAIGVTVIVEDALRRGLGRLIPFFSRDAYHWQVRFLRWSYGFEYLLFTHVAPARAVARWGMALFGSRPLRRLIASHGPDLVVSTHPIVTNVIGHLRRRGRLVVPTVATITDFGVHALWAHRGVDLHLVMHERALGAVERVAGKGSARAVRAIVAPPFRSPLPKRAARRALGLPEVGAVAVISGGGWGVGEIPRAAQAALEVPGLAVVCLSGRNESLRHRLEATFAGESRVRVVPFTSRMPAVLAAADVLVDATVGVTCLEALSVGCPVVVFGAPPGHSRENAGALRALGLAETPRSSNELTAALRRIGEAEQRLDPLPDRDDAVDAILSAWLRVRPIVRRRRRALPVAAAAALMLVLTGWTVASPTPYPVVARAFDLGPLAQVNTPTSQVAVIVVVTAAQMPQLERLLNRAGAHASFAVYQSPAATTVQTVEANGDRLLPALASGGAVDAFRTGTRLRRLARALDLHGRFQYLAPSSGDTLADYLAARAVGATPVVGTAWDAARGRVLRPGSIVVLDMHGAPLGQSLAALLKTLAGCGLRPVPLDELLVSARTWRTGAARERASAPPLVRSRDRTSAASCQPDVGHHSRASSGASATGTIVVSAKTSGAT
jgi:UDP-N-acetylglucosamine:LPS N-acetylglucosamine transferase